MFKVTVELVKFFDFRELANLTALDFHLLIYTISLLMDPTVCLASFRASSTMVSLSSDVEAGLGAETGDLGALCLAPAPWEVFLAITFTEK